MPYSFKRRCKIRYQEKISILNGIDPFTAGLGEPVVAVPSVDASDLLSYLVRSSLRHSSLLTLTISWCVCWIKDVCTWRVAGKYVTTGRVHISRFS